MKKGLEAKFNERSNPDLWLALKNTEQSFVECNRYDKVWGIGMDLRDKNKADYTRWGENKLGTLLNELRDQFN